MRRPSILATLLGLALLPAPLVAQGSAPFSCSDTTRTLLGALVGSYAVEALHRAGPAAWDSTTATSTITAALGGCVLREEFRGRRNGEPYDFLAIWGANGTPAARIQRTFVHSQHGILGLSNGAWMPGDTLVLEDSVFVRGRWVFQRVVLWRAGSGWANEGRRSEDGRGTWFPTHRFRYRRVEAPRDDDDAGRDSSGRSDVASPGSP